MAIARELTFRVIIWNQLGFVADLSGVELLFGSLPSETTERLRVSTGSEREVARRHLARMTNVDMPLQEHLALICRLGCPVRFVALAAHRHVLWQELSLMECKSERQGAGGHAPDVYEITSNVFDAGIHQGSDLLSGIPWECTIAALLSGFDPTASEIIPGTIGSGETFDPFVLADAGLPGYIGPYWQAFTGDSVNADGLLSGGPLTLEMELPIGGASLTLVGTGTIAYLDYFGNLLRTVSAGLSALVPDSTMFVRISITSASARPTLTVDAPGATIAPRSGESVACTVRSTAVDWDDASDPSYWLCPDPEGLICIVVGDQAAPAIVDCPPLAGTGETESGGACAVCLLTDATLGGDGIYRFSVLVADSDSDPFTIAAPTFASALSFTYAPGTFQADVGALTSGVGRTERQVDFRVVDAFFGTADTITVSMDANDGAGNQPTLTFTFTKNCGS